MSNHEAFFKSEEFFKLMENTRVQAYYMGEVVHFDIEEMYQAFKARLINELVVDIEHCSTQALLTETDDLSSSDH